MPEYVIIVQDSLTVVPIACPARWMQSLTEGQEDLAVNRLAAPLFRYPTI